MLSRLKKHYSRYNILIIVTIGLICFSLITNYYLKQSIDLSGIGNLLMGIAALLAFSAGKEYLNEKKSNAAATILASFRLHIENINEVIKSPSLYQYEGNYPFRISEINGSKIDPYWYRPGRLIQLEYGYLRTKVNESRSYIHGNDSLQLDELLRQLQTTCNSINGFLQAELGDSADRASLIKFFNDKGLTPRNFQIHLKDILNKAECMLTPIIKE